MKRRDFNAGAVTALGVVAVGLAVRPAVAADRTIGWVSLESPQTMAPFLDAFRAGLAARGFDGANQVRIVERYASGADAVPRLVAELERESVRLIVAQGPASVPAVGTPRSVPVVYAYSGDPLAAGIAGSMARPGRNATGMSFMSIELNPKRIELIRTILPDRRRIAMLSNDRHPGEEEEIAACQASVAPYGIELVVYRLSRAPELAPAVTRALDEGAQVLLAVPSAFMILQAETIVSWTRARGVPLISGWAQFAEAGALLTYGPNLRECYKRVAYYVARVLEGEPAGDLPFERPTNFELVINQKTAKALGVTIPPLILARADEVIE